MSSNQRKAETLGMPGGTANNRLRKLIIFCCLRLLDEYKEKFGRIVETPEGGVYPDYRWSLTCVKCKKAIESEDDMTIEHIVPWEGRPNGKELFWDIGNIAFSHTWCNRPHVAVLDPKPLNHGWYGYNKKGCRCDVCKEASKGHNQGRYEEGNCRSSTKAV